jgi:hypothetical protein
MSQPLTREEFAAIWRPRVIECVIRKVVQLTPLRATDDEIKALVDKTMKEEGWA